MVQVTTLLTRAELANKSVEDIGAGRTGSSR